MKYYIYYDKNGAFLGGLRKEGKPTDRNCKRVTKEEYINILAANGITYSEDTVPEKVETIQETSEITEEAK